MNITTRKDMERALVETAWAFYHKGEKVQYCGRAFNDTYPKWYGGAHRPAIYSTVEEATSQKSLFTVCSDYCYSVYDNALGMPLLGGRMNYTTGNAWQCTATPRDFAVARWVASAYNDGTGTYSEEDKKWGLSQKLLSLDEMLAFLEDWKTNLRPGDIFDVFSGPGGGHNLLYIGGGYILDSVGKSYDISAGMEKREERGSVRTLRTVEEMFLRPDSSWGIANYEKNNTPSFFCVLRPLDLITKQDVLDPDYVMEDAGFFHHDPNLPRTGFGITAAAFARVKYPGIEIDRALDVPVYDSLEPGQIVTCTVTLTNKSASESYCRYRTDVDGTPYTGEDYKGVEITEHLPQGTELVSVSRGAAVTGSTLHWTVDVPKGQTVTVSYSVKITAGRGESITFCGGNVSGIATPTLCNVVGGRKLPAEKLALLADFAAAEAAVWNSNEGYKLSARDGDTRFAMRIFEEILGLRLQLPTAQQLLDDIFYIKELSLPYGYGETYATPLHTWLYALNDSSVFRKMLIRGYVGGRHVYTDRFAMEPRINEFRPEDTQPGDIIVQGMLSPYPGTGEKRQVTETNIIVCLAKGKYAALNSRGEMFRLEGESALWKNYTYDFFFGLRPTQGYDDLAQELPAYDRACTRLLTEADSNRALDPWSAESMKRCFAKIQPDDWKLARFPISMRPFSVWVYTVAGLDIAPYMVQNIDEGTDLLETMRVPKGEPLDIGDLLCGFRMENGKKRFASAVKIDEDRFFCVTGLEKVGQSNECFFLSEAEILCRLQETQWEVYFPLRPSAGK